MEYNTVHWRTPVRSCLSAPTNWHCREWDHNAGNHWSLVLEIDKGWNASPDLTPFVHKFHCRRPQHPVMEGLVERGLFEGEAKLILSVVVLKHEDAPGVPRRRLLKSYTDTA
jgi:hypothetical protein